MTEQSIFINIVIFLELLGNFLHSRCYKFVCESIEWKMVFIYGKNDERFVLIMICKLTIKCCSILGYSSNFPSAAFTSWFAKRWFELETVFFRTRLAESLSPKNHGNYLPFLRLSNFNVFFWLKL